VSGGTYEYGYKYLNPYLGFTAGWMFLCAKSASAATAALGFAGYMLTLLDVQSSLWRMGLGLGAVVVLTVIILGGIRQSNVTNIAMLTVTLGALLFFVVAGTRGLVVNAAESFMPFFPPPSAGVSPWRALFHASALMFVAYTGYGRIATLGEEVRAPERTIPRAIVITLVVTMLLYGAVSVVAVGNVGAETFAIMTVDSSAPLELVAAGFGIPGGATILALGAVTAMLSVLLNLILGLSRVLMAMGRRRDMPPVVARISKIGQTPEVAVVTIGVLIAILVLIGDIRVTWSFSAFTVLVYYAITNLAALQLPEDKRRFPRAVSMLGLASCLFLAFWVEPSIWVTGLILILVGLGWRWTVRRM
jgi:APA family basic amino acid/polyamine antiporter